MAFLDDFTERLHENVVNFVARLKLVGVVDKVEVDFGCLYIHVTTGH